MASSDIRTLPCPLYGLRSAEVATPPACKTEASTVRDHRSQKPSVSRRSRQERSASWTSAKLKSMTE
eukprot:2413905-Alexandrium_andersonii.AAC.1